MTEPLRIIIAQLNFLVGDIQGNLAKIIKACGTAKHKHQADVIVFPELALTGYPPEDLLLRQDFHDQVQQALQQLAQAITDIDLVVGYPERTQVGLYNAAAFIRKGKIIANYHKQYLPNYGVFDEKRYFRWDTQTCLVTLKGIPTAITICEDLWYPEPLTHAAKAGAKLVLSINASPFDIHKLTEREALLRQHARAAKLPIIYAHLVGAQDEIIFDGRSIAMDSQGEICNLGPAFKEALIPVEIDPKTVTMQKQVYPKPLGLAAKTYQALVAGLHDYIHKNQFKGALIGLSGGIDSALTLAIAVDALDKDKVDVVFMPSRYSADISAADARAQADMLGVNYRCISIEPAFKAYLSLLKPEFADRPVDVTEENIQARCRATILMALSNKFGKLVLTTGNKSEMAVGYATLYGDMAGGFAVLKDVYKTWVYKLANYRNSINPAIPQRVIDRPPSAELAHGQVDLDSLPAYAILDQILERYVEQDQSIATITQDGFDASTVQHIVRLVDRNEYKRRQAPPGIKITTRAFGRDRRYPITSGFKHSNNPHSG